jgi:predicted glutamine amidotransferase
MCGLVGMVGTLEYKHKKAMLELLYLDTLRGFDSTGLATVNRKREYQLRKMAIPGCDFVQNDSVVKMMSWQDQLWIGHNRFKTTGDVSKANAHPFVVEDKEGNALLIGAHNGTLDNKFEIERNLGKKYDTDSEGLFNLLMEAPSFKDAISKLRGAWSLVFWDPTTDRINFCRNKERPLVYAYSKDRKVMVWASEAWMILAACRRNDVELETNDKGLSCYSTVPDYLYSMEIPQVVNRELPELEREGGYAGQARTFQGQWNNWWDGEKEDDNVRYLPRNQQSEEQEAAKKRAQEAEDAFKEDEKKILTLGLPPGTRRGYEGQPITDKEFENIKSRGCAWCDDPIEKVWAFIEDKAMVCNNCLNDSHPKGDCVRPDDLDDPPFDLEEEPRDTLKKLGRAKSHSKDSPEYKRLIEAAVTGAKAVG